MSEAGRRKRAIVLFNLGGPDGTQAIRPFLYNLFSDPAILRIPAPFRQMLAAIIARRRAPEAARIYARIGGASPLLSETEAQARALESACRAQSDEGETKVFVVMRYWLPRAPAVAAEVRAFGPDEIVLLPLYPQFSTTTTASSLAEWRKAAAAHGLEAPTTAVCCYPVEPLYVKAMAGAVRRTMEAAREDGVGALRILFSAHGLPERVVAAGDPYPWQIEETARRVAAGVGDADLDWRVCYQSRVGPVAWIGPEIGEEIARAAEDRVAVVVVPIAFVSEHSETLVELDIQYREVAAEAGVPGYYRVPALGADEAYIASLAGIAGRVSGRGTIASEGGRRLCPADRTACPMRGGALGASR